MMIDTGHQVRVVEPMLGEIAARENKYCQALGQECKDSQQCLIFLMFTIYCLFTWEMNQNFM